MRRALFVVAAVVAASVTGGPAVAAAGVPGRPGADATRGARGDCAHIRRGGRSTRVRRCARFSVGGAGLAGAAGRPGSTDGTTAGPLGSTTQPSGSSAGGGSQPSLPRRLAVDENDAPYSVRPSRNAVGAGSVEFNVYNRGQDDHDLTITNGVSQFGQVYVASGDSATLTVALPAGNYKLYCSLLSGLHDQWGMHAPLTVQ